MVFSGGFGFVFRFSCVRVFHSQQNNLFFGNFSDPRSEHLPLISSPWPIIGLVSLYLYFVLSLGPRWMEKQSPFQIKTVLIVYNSFQIVSNLLAWFYVSVLLLLLSLSPVIFIWCTFLLNAKRSMYIDWERFL